jgi:hypothetical protein
MRKYYQLVLMLAHANFGSAPKIKKRRKKRRKIGEHTGKEVPKKEEKSLPIKAVTKWTNCCGGFGKWTSVDLEKQLDRGPARIKSRRKWKNLILLGLGFL